MELVCRLLEVSRSGYYEWLGRKPSLRRQKDQELKRRLLSLHQRYPALGLDSLYHLIRPQLSCSRKRIHRLMNEMNISSTRRRAYKATTNSPSRPISLRAASPLTSQTPHGSAILPISPPARAGSTALL